MNDIKGTYTFVTASGYVKITCTLGFAKWLSGSSGRTHGGVFWSAPLKVYL